MTTRPTFAFGNPVAVAKVLQFSPPNLRTNYDVTPEGKLLGLVAAGQKEFVRGPTDRMYVVLNWLEELKQRVPVK